MLRLRLREKEGVVALESLMEEIHKLAIVLNLLLVIGGILVFYSYDW